MARTIHDNRGAPTEWAVRATGNITLAVLAASGEQVLKLDLLASRAMEPGDEGLRLARAWNNLALLASLPSRLGPGMPTESLPHPDAGHSPFPWRAGHNRARHGVVIHDANGQKIAEREFPAKMTAAREGEIVDLLVRGIQLLNQ